MKQVIQAAAWKKHEWTYLSETLLCSWEMRQIYLVRFWVFAVCFVSDTKFQFIHSCVFIFATCNIWLRACHLFSFSSCDAPSWALSLSAAGSADHVFKKLYSPIKCLHFVYFPWFCQHIYIFQMVLEVNSAISKCCVGQHTLHHCKLWLCFLNCSYLNWRRCSCPWYRQCWCISL